MTEFAERRQQREKNWAVTTIVHIWPRNDTIDHAIFGSGCSCGAEAKIEEDVGSDKSTKVWIITHNALDGRAL